MKILSNGIAVIEGDTHISKWVKDSNTLRIAEEMLAPFKKYVLPGDTVIDIGASIGDHTVTYADWVGDKGMVVAFEPNPEAYLCLLHNTKHVHQVLTVSLGLSDSESSVSLVRLANSGASYLSNNSGDVKVTTLDDFEFEGVSFIKIDAEGYETRILRGAKETIERNTPVMLIEVNQGALERSGSSADELLGVIRELGYSPEMTDARLNWDDPQYDVICLPTKIGH
jgi:FkbM family methyltransferase